jgi:hypothetical protein
LIKKKPSRDTSINNRYIITTSKTRYAELQNVSERNTSVPKEQIKFYYKNVMADIIGDEHGITPEKLKKKKKKTLP